MGEPFVIMWRSLTTSRKHESASSPRPFPLFYHPRIYHLIFLLIFFPLSATLTPKSPENNPAPPPHPTATTKPRSAKIDSLIENKKRLDLSFGCKTIPCLMCLRGIVVIDKTMANTFLSLYVTGSAFLDFFFVGLPLAPHNVTFTSSLISVRVLANPQFQNENFYIPFFSKSKFTYPLVLG